MKRSPRPRRAASKLPESIHHQLNMYALAAGAAGVGMLALAQPAQARIIYTPADVTIGHGGVGQYNLDLDHDGITEFIVANGYSCDYGCYYYLTVEPMGRNAVNVTGSLHLDPALHPGTRIGPHRSFTDYFKGVMVSAFYSTGRHFLGGHWINVRNRYLALRINVGGEIHYGWARFNVKVSRGVMLDITARLTGYAYETIPNKPIIAGKTKGPDVVTAQPETVPGSLGRLALGRK